MEKQTFQEEEMYFPINMEQFEKLVNEILEKINIVSSPHFVHADFMVQVVNSVLHSIDRREGIIKKTEVFERCVHLLGCQISQTVVEGIIAKLKEEQEKGKDPALSVVPEDAVEH